jgi:hypothetical protein
MADSSPSPRKEKIPHYWDRGWLKPHWVYPSLLSTIVDGGWMLQRFFNFQILVFGA